ncbi:peptidoglycan editing factor PgeF [uncultured Sunxiuqinia sp.]|uniref:peptidoglycan editing factor PgeF n=1 Tax=uncultured Sunxiuqinia sp. TaxID=1573825 RepID=UPI002AA65A33|nr:peptidoglycan editing factor PgeF [uncultured Sunxiuqinia sp.]
MRKIEMSGKEFYQFEIFDSNGLTNFCSTKIGWRRNGDTRFTGNLKDDYMPFRGELSSALKLSPGQLIFPRQNHGTGIQIVHKLNHLPDISETDALITNQPGICICVQTADCVPILLYDPVKAVIASVHAGWRGTVSQILVKTIQTMQANFNTNPSDISMGIGPSICQDNYEVGEDVIAQVKTQFVNHSDLLAPTKPGKAKLDLWEANKTLALKAGIFESQIEIMGLCSYQEQSLFYSARRDGADTGRMVSGIMLS